MDERIKTKVKQSFNKQNFMATLGAKIESIAEGEVHLSCKKKDSLTQQNGFFHAGVLSSLLDSACGYAALTVMPIKADVLSIEFKINLMRPALENKIIAVGTVTKAGAKVVVCEGEIRNLYGKLVASMQASMVVIHA